VVRSDAARISRGHPADRALGTDLALARVLELANSGWAAVVLAANLGTLTPQCNSVTIGAMKRAAALLAFVVGCRFELPEADTGLPVDAPGLPVDAPGCPADYAPLTGGTAGHLYKKIPYSTSYVPQSQYCRALSEMRAYLAVPNSPAELAGLYALAGDTFWVGINDRTTEGTFVEEATGGVWISSVPWASGEPDNGDGGPVEDCVAATASSISDNVCGASGGVADRPAVCECNAP
jgi:hypothetical protein